MGPVEAQVQWKLGLLNYPPKIENDTLTSCFKKHSYNLFVRDVAISCTYGNDSKNN